MKFSRLKELYSTNILSCSVIFSISLACTIRWLANRWSYHMQLHNRVVLLTSIHKIIEEWEELCLQEVEEFLLFNSEIKHSNLNSSLFKLSSSKDNNNNNNKYIAPFHGSVRSIAYAPGVNLSYWIQLWRMGQYLCKYIIKDMILIERLGYIIKYIAFRRLAVMEEARYYAAAYRLVFNNNNNNNSFYKLRMPLWLVGRRPFWIIPISSNINSTGKFICLPLSYFPVESILTSAAEETWIKEIVRVSPDLIKKKKNNIFNFIFIKKRNHGFQDINKFLQLKYPMSWRHLWKEIDHLFLLYGLPLAEGQLIKRNKVCYRFYKDKLFKGIKLVTGEGIDMDNNIDNEEYYFNNINKIPGRDVLYRNINESKRLKFLLYLRTISHAIRIIINLISPQYNFFTEWILFSTISSTVNNIDRENILRQFSSHVIYGSLTSVIGALIRSLDNTIKSKICTLLRDELVNELSLKIATADEAFLKRCLEEGSSCGYGSIVEKTFTYAENVASQIISRFDYEQRKRMSIFLVLIFSIYRSEIDISIFSAILAMLDYHDISNSISFWLGIMVEKELSFDLTRLEEEPLPSEPRYGLRIMMDVLLEKEYNHKDKSKNLYPFLTLIVCGGSFLLKWPLDLYSIDNYHNNSNNILKIMNHLKQIENLFDKVINNNYVLANKFSYSLRKNYKNPYVESLKQDAACIKEFVLKKMIKDYEDILNNSIKSNCKKTFLINKKAQSILQEEEIAILNNPEAMNHIPKYLSFEDIFNKKSRFILRQLGLETIFAYQAANLLRQNKSRSIKESLIDFVSSPFRNVFTQTLQHLLEFIEKVLFYTLLNYRINLSSILYPMINYFIDNNNIKNNNNNLGAWDAILLLGRLTSYRNVLREYEDCSFGPPFRLTQQIARYLPTTLHDVSSMQYSPILIKRRKIWMNHIKRFKKLKFDEIGRIISGFNLTKGINLYGIYFTYPQLRHSIKDGSLLPVLSDITVEFPAGHMTAIIGKTGSGKSTMLNLLKRIYDPVISVVIDENTNPWNNSQGLLHCLNFYLNSYLPMPNQTNYSNVIFIDGIPMNCFSTSYLRNAFGMLEQSPCIFEKLSFFQNISLLTPSASLRDVSSVAQACSCAELIAAHPLAYAAGAGALSAGEGQRVGLARALLAAKSGARVLLLDEPTARLDGFHAGRVEAGVLGGEEEGEGGQLTILIISHRLSTLQSATHAILLDHGQLLQQGTLQNLAESSEIFQHLVATQELPLST